MKYSNLKNDFKIISEIDSEEIQFNNYINLSKNEREKILEWRNNPEISKWFFSDKKISIQEHDLFLKDLQRSENKFYWLVKNANSNIGTINLTRLEKQTDLFMWGIYVNPEFLNFGVGVLLTYFALEFFFEKLEISTLYGEVKLENKSMLRILDYFQFDELKPKLNDAILESKYGNKKFINFIYTSENWTNNKNAIRKQLSKIKNLLYLTDKKN